MKINNLQRMNRERKKIIKSFNPLRALLFKIKIFWVLSYESHSRTSQRRNKTNRETEERLRPVNPFKTQMHSGSMRACKKKKERTNSTTSLVRARFQTNEFVCWERQHAPCYAFIDCLDYELVRFVCDVRAASWIHFCSKLAYVWETKTEEEWKGFY